jgi:metal-responsive CopG/Arc/MetJ family transcriptional regulator
MTNVKLDNALVQRAAAAAKKAGYSSLEEFIGHAIEKQLAQYEDPEMSEEMKRQLKGLGYIE